MGRCPSVAPATEELEVSAAAVGSYARLLAGVPGSFRTHGCRDGGLICEERSNRARPIVWRILADGSILPDTRYNYAVRGFVTAALPSGV
jgi:hypothetical protein